MDISRRDFITTTVAGSIAFGAAVTETANAASQAPGSSASAGKRPIIISAGNGLEYLDAAYDFLKGGGDTLDAAIRVVKGPEDDPKDDSVGLGGLPNEEGVVELDACCMHGPSRRAGSVGGVRNIRNVVDGRESGHRAHRPRDAGRRRRRAVRGRDGLSLARTS